VRFLAIGDGVQQHEHQLNSLAALIPACLLLVRSAVLLLRARTASALLQLVGAGFLTVVVLSHICEVFDLVPLMQWGLPDSAGHYLDLLSAVLGLALFSIGYLWHAIAPIKR
jgi:hypothetical protein